MNIVIRPKNIFSDIQEGEFVASRSITWVRFAVKKDKYASQFVLRSYARKLVLSFYEAHDSTSLYGFMLSVKLSVAHFSAAE